MYIHTLHFFIRYLTILNAWFMEDEDFYRFFWSFLSEHIVYVQDEYRGGKLCVRSTIVIYILCD